MSNRFPIVDAEPVSVSSPNAATWRVLGELEQQFPGGWVLIGGLMVFLLGAEVGQTPMRVTADADILIRVKVLTAGTRNVSMWLIERGFQFEGANAFELGHRFSAGGVSVDVLVPSGLGERAERRTIGSNVAAEVEGGPGLLDAGELVGVSVEDDEVVMVPRPRLSAAIIGKAKAATRLDEPQRHCQDLAFLFGLVAEPTEMAGTYRTKDRRLVAQATTVIADHFAWLHAGDEQAAQATARILSQS